MKAKNNPTQETQQVQKAQESQEIHESQESQENQETVGIDQILDKFSYYSYCHQTAEFKFVPAPDFQEALIYGFVGAMHKTHTVCDALFLTGTAQKDSVMHDLSDVMPKLVSIAPELAHCVDEYLYNNADFVYSHVTFLYEAFITGYLAGLHKSGKYDRCLFLSGYALENQILADLIAAEKSEENARRAAARMVVKRFGLKKDNFRAMVFTDKVVDDDGNPVLDAEAVHDTASVTEDDSGPWYLHDLLKDASSPSLPTDEIV